MTGALEELQQAIDKALTAREIAANSALDAGDIGTAVRDAAEAVATAAHYIQRHLREHLEREHPAARAD